MAVVEKVLQGRAATDVLDERGFAGQECQRGQRWEITSERNPGVRSEGMAGQVRV